MIALLLLAILVVLILGFWGDEGLAFLMILGVGALALVALAIVLILFGISVGSVLLLWNTSVVPFWNAHKEILEPPLVSIAVIAIWLFVDRKFRVVLRGIAFQFSISNDTMFEKIMFFLVGLPSLLIVSMLVLAGLIAPIVFVAQQMQRWWLVISAE